MSGQNTHKVSKEIQKRILDFTYSPGFRLSDKEISQELGISRSPVREALNRLTAQGIVEARTNRGFRVRIFSPKEVEDSYILRERLETLSVRLATGRLNESMRHTLKSLVESYPELIESENLFAYSDADERFHELIAIYSDNSALHETLKNLQSKIRLFRRLDNFRRTSHAGTYKEHLQILEKMTAGDVEEAVRLMSAHVLGSLQLVMKALPK